MLHTKNHPEEYHRPCWGHTHPSTQAPMVQCSLPTASGRSTRTAGAISPTAVQHLHVRVTDGTGRCRASSKRWQSCRRSARRQRSSRRALGSSAFTTSSPSCARASRAHWRRCASQSVLLMSATQIDCRNAARSFSAELLQYSFSRTCVSQRPLRRNSEIRNHPFAQFVPLPAQHRAHT